MPLKYITNKSHNHPTHPLMFLIIFNLKNFATNVRTTLLKLRVKFLFIINKLTYALQENTKNKIKIKNLMFSILGLSIIYYFTK